MIEQDAPASRRFVLWHPRKDAFHATGGWTTDPGEAMSWKLLETAEQYRRTRPWGVGTYILTIVVRVDHRDLVTMDLCRKSPIDLIDHIKPYPEGMTP